MFVDLGSNSNLNKPVIFYLSTCLEYNTILEKENCDSIKSCIFVYFETLRPYYNSFGALEIIIGLGF